ncbi:MAG: hypothetical protein Q4F13_07270 [Pseudomonadota bacterium]|nr:hypothetical protein [Pseudomonadota bacterium]
MKPLHRHPQATWDVQQALGGYLAHAGEGVAGRFVQACEAALTHIARHQPGTGPLRHAPAAAPSPPTRAGALGGLHTCPSPFSMD